MSALQKMLMQSITNGLDPEVTKWLTPEGITKLGEELGKIVQFNRMTMTETTLNTRAILANQKVIMEALNVGSQFCDGRNPIRPSDNNGGTGEQHAA